MFFEKKRVDNCGGKKVLVKIKVSMAESSVCGCSVWDSMVEEEEQSRSDARGSHMVSPKDSNSLASDWVSGRAI